jgi:hypothetical protein
MEYFREDTMKFIYRNRKLKALVEARSKDLLILKLANIKKQSLELNFQRQSFENHPSCYIIINNDPRVQVIAIQYDKVAFGSTDTAIDILHKALDAYLINFNLGISIKPILDEKQVWRTLEKYKGRISKLHFEFGKPNLARINKTLSEELKTLSRNVNSATTVVEFNAPKDHVLENISKQNSDLDNLVKAITKGAGETRVKLKGVRTWESMKDKIKGVFIDEIDIKHVNKLFSEEALNELREKVKKND